MPKKGNIYITAVIAPHDPNESGRTSISLKDVQAQVKALGKFDELDVHIRSQGGNVQEGYAIRDYIQSLGVKVNTIIEGLCASIATIVQQSNCNGGTRQMWSSSEFFIHNPWAKDVSGDAAEFEAYAKSLKAEETKMAAFYSERSKADVSVIAEYMKEQKTFSPDEAIALGFVDEIIDISTKAIAFLPANNSIETIIEQKMSGLKENIAKILALVTPTKVKAMQYKLEDGTEVFVDGELVEGTTVHIGVDATGELAPDGVHMIEGVNVTTEGGKITKIEDYVDVEALKAQVADLTAKLAEKESIEAKANEALELAEQAIEAKEAQIVALNTKIGSNYTPAPRQKQVLAKKQEPGEINRIAEAKERKADYKPKTTLAETVSAGKKI
jgi:ATP-dependent protease ClpP protease subunit